MASFSFGFIGCGNMGGALVRALSTKIDGNQILITDRISQNVQALHDACGVCVANDAVEVAANATYIFLGVKPKGLSGLLAELRPVLAAHEDRYVLVSMLAGVTVSTIQQTLALEHVPVIRILPNTPAAVGAGLTLYCTSPEVTEREEHEVVRALEAAGLVDRLEEHLIDAGCAVSGCGPAFVYLFMEALADGAVAAGLPRQKAMLYAAQTVQGASQMLLQSGKHPGELKDAVCSPGGSTIMGVQALEQGAFRGTVMDAVLAAFEKTKALGK